MRRALLTALVVGPILTLINQTAVLLSLVDGRPIPELAGLRIGLTFAVPFVVSLISAALADSRRDNDEPSPLEPAL